MKKILVANFICALFCLQVTFAITLPPWPIPSYNIPFFGREVFQANVHSTSDNSEGRRRIHIQVSSQKTPDTIAHSATIWVYSLDYTTIYGPFAVNVGTTLTVEIDDREWGVLVESDPTIVVSVWITRDD